MSTSAVIYGSATSPFTFIVPASACVNYAGGDLYYLGPYAVNRWVHNNYYIFGSDPGTSIHGPQQDYVYCMAARLRLIRYNSQNCYLVNNAQHSLSTAYNSTMSVSGPGSIRASLGCSGTISGQYSNVGPYSFSWSHEKTITDTFWNSSSVLHMGGETVQMIATPDEHCRVKQWTRNGAILALADNTNWIHTFPGQDFNLVCEFEQYEWPVTIKGNNGSAGHVTVEKSSEWMEAEQTIEVSAVTDDTENYTFLGWYKGYGDNLDASACTTRVTTEAVLTIVTEQQAATYVAKWGSRITELKVDVDGEGAFDLTVNGNSIVTDATEYQNVDARDGWRIDLTAKPASGYYFAYWVAPLGETLTENIYASTFSTDLISREQNHFTAKFLEKKAAPISGCISGIGKVSYSGDLVSGYFDETSTEASPHLINDTLAETEYRFAATNTSRLYAFDRWEYKVGDGYEPIVEGALPNWVRQLGDGSIVVFVPRDTESSTRGLRAVFRKLNTYTISEPVIEGAHAINKNLASADSSNVVSGLPTPDEVVDGVSRWLEGTSITLRATAGSDWVVEGFILTTESEGSVSHQGESVTFVLNEDVGPIYVRYEAKQYRVSAKVDDASASVGEVTFTYQTGLNTDGQPITATATEADVYVKTPVTLRAVVKDGFSERVAFQDWSYNGIVDSSLGATASGIQVLGDSAFVARFAADVVFSMEGAYEYNGTLYPYGRAALGFRADGYDQTIVVPDGETYQVTRRLVCGTELTFVAEALTIQPAEDEIVGHFVGWFEQNSEQTWDQIDGWGERVEGIVLKVPRVLRARFSRENRWPILRLVNPPVGEEAVGRYCTFALSGVKSERVQPLEGDTVIDLTNHPDMWFCDPFSTVQVRLEVFQESTRFLKWSRFAFPESLDTPAGTGDVMVEETYAETRDLSLFMTGNLYLKPIFYTGTPIWAEAALAVGSTATMGDVSIDGEAIEVSADSTRASFVQGDIATFVASPRNGYKFVGWYAVAAPGETDTPVSVSPRFDVTMSVMQKFFAVFAQDRNAIYTFGTGTEPKTMVWRSKRSETAAPISLSVAQVDAEGYDDVKLTVYHASSPDVPYKMESYAMKDGNSRRLRMGARPEKAFEIEIESHTPVNRVTVATSVTALSGQ